MDLVGSISHRREIRVELQGDRVLVRQLKHDKDDNSDLIIVAYEDLDAVIELLKVAKAKAHAVRHPAHFPDR